LTSGALVLFIALIAEPAAEPLKPIPPIAQAIETSLKPGDTIAIGGVSGSNGLAFYTRPPIVDFKNNAGFVATICASGDGWIVVLPQDADRLAALSRSLHRAAQIVMQRPTIERPRAALLHIWGPACSRS